MSERSVTPSHGTPEQWVGVGFITAPGAKRSLFEEAIRPLSLLVDREASVERIPPRSQEEAGVVLVFLVPAEIMPSIAFTGMRTSSYFKAEHSKQVQVAVPADLSSPDELHSFLRWAIRDAPPVALKALRRQRIPASMECAAEAAERVVANLGEVVAAAQLARARSR